MRTFEEQMRQAEKVLDATTGLFAELETPEQAVSIVMTLLDTFIELHPDQEEKTLKVLETAIVVRDQVIALSGMMFNNAEGMN